MPINIFNKKMYGARKQFSKLIFEHFQNSREDYWYVLYEFLSIFYPAKAKVKKKNIVIAIKKIFT